MLPDDDERAPATVPLPEVPAPEVEDETAEPETEEQDQEEAVAETDETGDEDQAEGEQKQERERTEREKRNERYQRQAERDRQRAQRLEAENAELRASVGSLRLENVDALVERAIGPPPNPNDPKFQGDWLAYDRAVTVYEMRRVTKAEQIREQTLRYQAANQQTQEQVVKAFRERADEIRDMIPNYDAVIKSATDAHVEPHVQSQVYESPEGPRIAYMLALHRDVLNHWNGLTEKQVAREIGRFESSVGRSAGTSPPNPRTQTRAPAPIRPLTGGAAPPSQESGLRSWGARRYGKTRASDW